MLNFGHGEREMIPNETEIKTKISSKVESHSMLIMLILLVLWVKTLQNIFICCILSSKVRTFFIENDAEILPVHYTWKVAFANLIHKQIIQVKL